MLHEAHVMARFDACHGKERHSLAGAVQGARPGSLRDGNLHWAVGHSLPVTVDLKIHTNDNQVTTKENEN